jgi:hypothetical protein
VDDRTDALEHPERVRVRVAVGVVRTDRDQRHPRCGTRQERRVAGPRTVVWDGQEAGPERVVPAGRDPCVRRGEQIGLRGQLRVAEEQRDRVADRHPEDQGPFVHLAVRVPVRAARRWAEHLEVQRADRGRHRAVAVADDLAHRGAGGLGGPIDRVHRRGRLGRRGTPQGRGVRALEHRWDAAGVIGVPVGHHDQVEIGVAVALQPPCGHVPVAGVDQHPRTGTTEQEGVALPDVDRRDGEGVYRQVAAEERREPGQDEGDDGDRRRSAGGPGPWRGQQPTRAGEECGDRRGCGQVGGAAPAGGRVRRGEDAACREGRDREQCRPGGHVDGSQGAGGERDGGGDHRERDGDEVRGHARHRDLAEGREQQRHHGELRADRDGQDVRDAARQPPPPLQPPTHPRRQHEDARGGRRREQQAERPGQERIDQDQEEDRTGEGVAAVAGDPALRGQQDHPRDGACPEHRRLEAGEVGEPQHHDRHRGAASTRAGPHERAEPEHPRDDGRDVHARHGGQVGHRRRFHRGAVGVRQQPRVPAHEADEQAADRRRGVRGRGGPGPGADVLARGREPAGVAGGDEDADVQHHRQVLLREPPAVAAVRQRARRARRPPPAAERRGLTRERWSVEPITHQGDRGAFAGPPSVHLGDADRDVPAGRDATRLGGDRQRQVGGAASGRQFGEHAEVVGGRPRPGQDRGQRRDDDQERDGSGTGRRAACREGGAGDRRDDGDDHGGPRHDRRPLLGRGRGERGEQLTRPRPGGRTDDGHQGPRAERADDVRDRRRLGVRGRLGDRCRRRCRLDGRIGHPTVTRSAMSWNRFSPIPLTSRRSPG